MTRERRTTILVLIGTLVLGMLIGMLAPGLVHKYRGGGMQRGRGGSDRDYATKSDVDKKDWFAHTINRVVKPDSTQGKQIKPITEWASLQIEAVETSSNARMSEILDSVNVQLKPILTEEQQKRLTEFQTKAQGKWKGRGDRGGRR